MNPDEFLAALEDHRILYLKGSDRKIFLKKSFDDAYVLGHVTRENMTQGFQMIADGYRQMKFGERNWFWLSAGGIVICDLCSDEWEVDA